MNCREFRHRLLVDPGRDDPEMERHAAACPPCAAERSRARAFEERLRAALTAEPEAVPVASAPGSTGRNAGQNAGGNLGPSIAARRRSRAVHAVAAATLVSILGLVGGSIHRITARTPTPDPEARALAFEVMAHIASEPQALAATQPVPGPRVELLLASLGLTIDARTLAAGLEPVRFAARCRVGERDALHLVLGGTAGPVTLVLLPRASSRRAAPIRSDGFTGLLIPAGRGSLGIVGTGGESVTPIARRLQRTLGW